MTKYVGTIIYDSSNNSILLVENRKNENLSVWSFPAGSVEKDESVLDGAMREVFEETNLDVVLSEKNFLKKYVGSLEYVDGNFEFYVYFTNIFFGELVAGDDAFDSKWFNLQDILLGVDDSFFEVGGVRFNLRDNNKLALRDFLKFK